MNPPPPQPATEAAPSPPAASRRLRLPSWFGRAVFESLLIVFSLLLALALNDWAADRRMQGRVEEARGFFLQELQANRAALLRDDRLPHHQRLTGALNDFLAIERPAPADGARLARAFNRGINPAFFRDAVWRSVSGGEVMENMTPAEVFALADVYRMQEELSALNRSVYVTLLSTAQQPEDTTALRRQAQPIRAYMTDVVFSELELVRVYDAAIARLRAAQR